MIPVVQILNIVIVIALVAGLIYWLRSKPQIDETASIEKRPLISGWGIFLIAFFVIPMLNHTPDITPSRIPFHISFDTIEERFEFLQAVEEHLPTEDAFITGGNMPDTWWNSFNTVTFVSHNMGWSVMEVRGHIEMGTDALDRPSVTIHPFTQHTGFMVGVGWQEIHTFINLDNNMITAHTVGSERFAILPFFFWGTTLELGGSGVMSSNGIAWLVQTLNTVFLIALIAYFILRRRTNTANVEGTC